VQDYKEAARLRDSLRSFEEEEPVLRLRGLMRKAIEEERFEVFYSCIAVVSSNQIASLSRYFLHVWTSISISKVWKYPTPTTVVDGAN